MKLMIRRLIGKLLSQMFPAYGRCGKCGLPWNSCRPHSTIYKEGHGVFSLCEECWILASINERLYFYETLIRRWLDKSKDEYIQDIMERSVLIKKAVLDGK